MVLGLILSVSAAPTAGTDSTKSGNAPACEQHDEVSSEREPANCVIDGREAGTYCSICGITLSGREPIPALGHTFELQDPKPVTYTGVGWDAYELCTTCGYSTRVEIPTLEAPVLEDYDLFLAYLNYLEQMAYGYVQEHPGVDPLDLVIKYIRTGVDRYNSGSWGIMAGYEDAGFAEFIAVVEDELNITAPSQEEMLPIFSSLKNLGLFELPNGDIADIGHMFGTLDITYHNKFSVNHADVAGWAGDLVDLMEFADLEGVDGTLEEMIADVSANFLGKTPEDSSRPSFSQMDIYGDLDGFYVTQMLQKTEYNYDWENEIGGLAALLMEYFTEDLSEAGRADFFLRNRLGGASTRSEIRDAVYNAFISNKVVATLEATREFSSENLSDLRKACCYAFADYLCKLAGDYVEGTDTSYFTVFSTEKSTLAPGVKQEIKYATTADGEQTVFYLATADITRDDVNVYANYNNNEPGAGWSMQRVLDQANAAQNKYGDPESEHYIPNYSVVASTNGSGFNMATGQPGGLLVMGGVEYNPINNAGFFGILKDGTAVIGTTQEYNTIYKGQVQEGIAGFNAMLIKDGKIVVPASDNHTDDRAGRTAVGITRTGKVVLMVMDGRQLPASCGGSLLEIAQVMLEAGCVDAVNLDGGGSTTYVAKPEGEAQLKVVNVPSDGYARSVSTSLMIVSTAPDSTAFDHALVDSPVDYMMAGASMQMTASGVSATGNPAEIPEGAVWAVSSERVATIDANGVLTARRTGLVDVKLMVDDTVIGYKSIEVITYPQNVYFTRTNLNAVYGEKVALPVKVLYNNKEVAITEANVTFDISPAGAGTVDGFVFNVAESGGVKTVVITATVAAESGIKEANLTISLYKQGETTFDFDQATGGNRQLAWGRQVSNATTEDEITYTVVDSSEKMVTSYTLALDMTQIPIPQRLEELIYMLPGADTPDASAWTFLCNLAERVSVLSTVKPVVYFDPNVEVDCSDLTIINDYFELVSSDFDEEENSMTLTLRWKDQTQAIKPETANPLCIVNGIKLTVKDDVQWGEKNRLTIVNGGEIGYTICLRASSLYTFAQKEENQEIFGLYPYKNEALPSDAGGSFSSTYITFEDSYTLVNAMKSGWIPEGEGVAYYVNGQKLTGVQAVDGVYYDFGTQGINVGQTPYTGIFKDNDGNTRYTRQGRLLTSGWYLVDGVGYHCHSNGTAHVANIQTTLSCTRGGQSKYTCTKCGTSQFVGDYIMPSGHDWDENYKCRREGCGVVGKNIADATVNFGTIDNPRTSTSVPRYKAIAGGVRPSTYVTFDGKYALSYSNDANLNADGTMRDLYIFWTNDRGIGKAYTHYQGKGDYYGEAKLEYILIPNDVKNLRAKAVSHNSITLTWDLAPGADYYRLYRYNNGSRTFIANVYGTSYTVTGLSADTEYSFQAATSAVSTDGENKTYNCSEWSNTLKVRTDLMPESTGLVKQAAMKAGNSNVTMLTVDGQPYFFLPADADLTKLNLALTLDDEAAGGAVKVSGSRSTASGTASGKSYALALDLTQLAAADTDGGYTIGIAVGQYRPMNVKVLCSKNIPSMFITSDDPAQGRAYVDASKANETTAQMTLTEADGTVLYNGALTQVKARGNSTFGHYPKKSYQIKLDQKSDLIGQDEKVKTWVLLANYGDATMMHDKFFKDLAAQMDMPYVAGCDWVNLWYDGEYRGVYLLSEKNSVGSTSVDITDLEEAYEEQNSGYGEAEQIATSVNKYGQSYDYTTGLTDPETITGGYLIELNHQAWDEVNGFKTKQGVAFNVKSPEWASDAAMKYISEYYQEFEDAVYATDEKGSYTGYNFETGKYFYDYVDMDSLVKVFLIQELGLNPDGFISSLYFYKDVDGKMYAGPIWDQDMTLGTGWTKYLDSGIVDYHYLAEALIKIPAFKTRVVEYFNQEFAPMVRAALVQGGTIDRNYALLAENAELNYLLWPYIRVGLPTASNHIWNNTDYDAVVADMESWMSDRLAKLGTIFEEPFKPGDVNHDGELTSRDAVMILRKAVGYDVPDFYEGVADFNGDGNITSRDAVEVLRKAVGY